MRGRDYWRVRWADPGHMTGEQGERYQRGSKAAFLLLISWPTVLLALNAAVPVQLFVSGAALAG